MPRRDARPLERAAERLLVSETERRGGVAEKLGLEGWPDRMLLLPGGRVAFVELKRQGEVPSPLQDYTLGRLRALGLRVAVLDSAGAVRAFFLEWLG